MPRRRSPQQLELVARTWGGKRAGAGRKPTAKHGRYVPHVARPEHERTHPAHVTMRVVAKLPPLRSQVLFRIVREELAAASRGAFRITAFSVQEDHVHLVVEAADRVKIARGMQRFGARVARRINMTLGRRGRVFRERYHRHDLRTPREVRNAYVYVLMNRRKHANAVERYEGLDPFSSIRWFSGLTCRDGPERLERALDALASADTAFVTKRPPVAKPDTWLGRVGWRRHGPIELHERPASASV